MTPMIVTLVTLLAALVLCLVVAARFRGLARRERDEFSPALPTLGELKQRAVWRRWPS